MAHQIPVLGSSTEQMLGSDTANTPNALVERDSSGNVAAGAGTFAGLITGGLGIILKSTAKTANFTASKTESTFYVVDSTAGSVTVALPAAASSAGVVFGFVKTIAANSLILDGNASETVGGATTKTATAQYAAITIWCDGSAWHILSNVGTFS